MIGKPGELDGSTTRLCPGKSGLGVLISEDDLRETVSVGRNHKKRTSSDCCRMSVSCCHFWTSVA